VLLPERSSEHLRYAEDERRWSQWMARANEGDAEAYQCLMTEIATCVEAYLRARFGAIEILEDCVQECLLTVHRARHTYDPTRAFRPWLFTLVRHRTIDLLRRRDVRTRASADPERAGETADWSVGDPGAGLEGARLLARLDPSQAEALSLTKFAGYSITEAATRAGVSPSAMKTRVHRGLRAVRKLLEEEGTPT
jgi:RNA polymerase sigma-70 factor (ECF subfamily)